MDIFGAVQLLFMLMFCGMFIFKNYTIIKSGNKAFAKGSKISKIGRAAILLVVGWIVLLFVEIAYQSFNVSSNVLPWFFYLKLWDNIWFKIAGVIIILISIILCWFALKSAGLSWRVGIDNNNPGKLVTTGAFAISRNPYFTGFILYLAGNMIITFNLFFILSLVFGIAAVHYQVISEEKALEVIYKDEYREYKKRVRRYF